MVTAADFGYPFGFHPARQAPRRPGYRFAMTRPNNRSHALNTAVGLLELHCAPIPFFRHVHEREENVSVITLMPSVVERERAHWACISVGPGLLLGRELDGWAVRWRYRD